MFRPFYIEQVGREGERGWGKTCVHRIMGCSHYTVLQRGRVEIGSYIIGRVYPGGRL